LEDKQMDGSNVGAAIKAIGSDFPDCDFLHLNSTPIRDFSLKPCKRMKNLPAFGADS